ncbi:MAG: glutathione S-transferase N-terminal domain-containing protein [Polyangiales bacterium]
MKLYYTPTSPFVRKVLVAAHELGLADRVETVLLRPSPTQADPTLSHANPLNKIPALTLDDGTALYDSPVICEYLDALAGGGKLLPASGAARWDVLRTQALADGVLDASILVFYERLHRPKELHWQAWLDGQTQKALQGLDALDAVAARFGDAPDLGQVAAACALGWLEFRAPFGDVRAGRPNLTAWYERFAARPSMTATAPHG